MGKTAVPHRIVVLDTSGRIVSEQHFPNMSEANPAFEVAKALIEEGQVLELRHGARVVDKHTYSPEFTTD